MKLEQLIELAKEVEMADPIDWEGLSISESAAYTLIASSILERYESGEIDNTVLDRFTPKNGHIAKLHCANSEHHLLIIRHQCQGKSARNGGPACSTLRAVNNHHYPLRDKSFCRDLSCALHDR